MNTGGVGANSTEGKMLFSVIEVIQDDRKATDAMLEEAVNAK